MNNYEIAEMLHDIASYIMLADSVMKLPSCNDCGKLMSCEHRPEWGATVRYNCFDWTSKTEEKDD